MASKLSVAIKRGCLQNIHSEAENFWGNSRGYWLSPRCGKERDYNGSPTAFCSWGYPKDIHSEVEDFWGSSRGYRQGAATRRWKRKCTLALRGIASGDTDEASLWATRAFVQNNRGLKPTANKEKETSLRDCTDITKGGMEFARTVWRGYSRFPFDKASAEHLDRENFGDNLRTAIVEKEVSRCDTWKMAGVIYQSAKGGKDGK